MLPSLLRTWSLQPIRLESDQFGWPGVIGLGLVGDGADGLALHAVFGVEAKEIDVPVQIVFLRFHGLHHRHGGDHVVNGPVGDILLNISSSFPLSTMCPAYITATLSHTSATTPRS